jgi:CRISPR/Cas system Type II protein with McrA/HNH and RuvC-like nuclease domain
MRVLGLDVGIASIGWALIEIDDIGGEEGARGEILAAGVWKFDSPEEKTQNGSRLKSEIRRNVCSRAMNFCLATIGTR